MGLFKQDYSKPGAGVSKNQPEKRWILVFFESLWSHLGRIELVNLVFLLFSLPVFALIAGICIGAAALQNLSHCFRSGDSTFPA